MVQLTESLFRFGIKVLELRSWNVQVTGTNVFSAIYIDDVNNRVRNMF
jgi:hypothetical protein